MINLIPAIWITLAFLSLAAEVLGMKLGSEKLLNCGYAVLVLNMLLIAAAMFVYAIMLGG